jgi:hypothetical protein
MQLLAMSIVYKAQLRNGDYAITANRSCMCVKCNRSSKVLCVWLSDGEIEDGERQALLAQLALSAEKVDGLTAEVTALRVRRHGMPPLNTMQGLKATGRLTCFKKGECEAWQ